MGVVKDFPCRRCGVPHPLGQHVKGPQKVVVVPVRESAQSRKITDQFSRNVAAATGGAPKIEKAAPVVRHPVGAELAWAVGEAKKIEKADDPVLGIDPWAGCPNCAARRARDAAAHKRARAKKGGADGG
jgi:hypothetical protein